MDDDTKAIARRCANCGHMAYSHRPECDWRGLTNFRSFGGKSVKCTCDGFVEAVK